MFNSSEQVESSIYMLSGALLICIDHFMGGHNDEDGLGDIVFAPFLNTLVLLLCLVMLVGRTLSSPLILLRNKLRKQELAKKYNDLLKSQ